MLTWRSDAHGANRSAPLDPAALTIRLAGSLGAPAFPDLALESLAAAVPIAYVTAYRKVDDAPVAMRFSASLRAPDVTARCWRIYRDGPYRRDHALDAASAVANHGLGWCHLTADGIEDRRHRVDVYERHGLIDRLSLVEPCGARGWFALNFFRVADQGHFGDRDFAALEAIAPLVMALARRHAELVAPRTATRDERLARSTATLSALGLTPRESAVCSRLAIGMTYDGIAIDLGIAVTSAKTYRNRGFERLGIRNRHELMASCFVG